MSYCSIATNNLVKSGNVNIMDYDDIQSPYNYLSLSQNVFFQMAAPFSLNFTRFEANEENPFRMTILSPDFSLNTILSRDEFEEIVQNRPLHQHDTYELVYILKGELYQRIENLRHKYAENGCCFINRNIRHTEEYGTSFHTVTLSISRDFLEKILIEGEDSYFEIEKEEKNSDFSTFLREEFQTMNYSQKKYIDFIPEPSVQNIKQYIYSLLDELSNILVNPTPGSTLYVKAIIYRIMYYLDNPDYYLTKSTQLGTKAEGKLFAEITHLMEETNGRINRSQLSARLNYSGNYINHIIKKYTGLNTFEYGVSFTMQKAAWMLIHSTNTVSSIISELGFSDRTHFYNQFQKEYGMTPREYRKKNKVL
ncbi:AraC family transcriptional regulator [Parablautia intestinalis]|uniref:AraC family transcriptional regulator n=1 Tax=Parablautia intestinalis TaxID=2320100 RepID=A0A3A9AL94_9FIRM|nr:helix-turn-helix transcriptional regulator [Parablautia intestinalis]RKI88191.1 AraC family transcriptional regulator [Parablautia intestinalis]